ncbi:alpha/beta fold hydrolase [Streptomyces sp. SudanB66_2053]|uniref:alpha/beta fold hydrolase n=1 Tax=Streptomyces sp. SudanB66_2053 TaxID=3035277 RepID=UPI003F575241
MTIFEPITGRYVTVNGARTYFDEAGKGTPIVCIHPGATDSRIYRHLLPLLAERGFRAIAPDLPGHCRSYPAQWRPGTSIHDHAEFVQAFVRTVLPGISPFVVGVSVGGLAALDLAAHHGENYQGVIAMQAASWTPLSAEAAALLTGRTSAPDVGWTDHLEHAAVTAASKSLTTEQKTELRWLQRSTSQQACEFDGQAWASHDLRGRLGDVRCPVLLVHGTDDPFVQGELVDGTVAEIGSSAQLLRVPGIGHYPPFENPQRVAHIVEAFVRKLTAKDNHENLISQIRTHLGSHPGTS